MLICQIGSHDTLKLAPKARQTWRQNKMRETHSAIEEQRLSNFLNERKLPKLRQFWNKIIFISQIFRILNNSSADKRTPQLTDRPGHRQLTEHAPGSLDVHHVAANIFDPLLLALKRKQLSVREPTWPSVRLAFGHWNQEGANTSRTNNINALVPGASPVKKGIQGWPKKITK